MNGNLKIAFPMVSFSDLPLSEAETHIEKYENYGIGMKKGWAKGNNLNPVLYFEQKSIIFNELIDKYKSWKEDTSIPPGKMKEIELHSFTRKLLGYCENYEGDIPARNKINYRFSDEREWRYIPYNCNPIALFMDEEEFEAKTKTELNSKISFELQFEYKDISFIIISDSSETNEFQSLMEERLSSENLIVDIITKDRIPGNI